MATRTFPGCRKRRVGNKEGASVCTGTRQRGQCAAAERWQTQLLSRSGRSAGGGEWGKAEGSAIAIRWHRRGRKQKNSKGRRIGKTLRVQRWGDVGKASWHVRVLPSRMGTGIAEQGQQGIWGNGVGGDPASKRRKSTSRSFFLWSFLEKAKGRNRH